MIRNLTADRFSRPALALVASAAAVLAPTPLAAQSPAQIYAQISEQLEIDAKCSVLAADQRLAMQLIGEEYKLQTSAPDQSAVATWLTGLKTNLAGVACSDPRLTGPIAKIKEAPSLQQDIFAARVQAIGRLRGSTNWASMSDISGVKSTAADKVMDALRSRNRDAAKQFSDQARLEAERALSILCPSMSIARANCPALAAPLNPGEAQFAAAWLERVEKYAAQMPGGRLDGKPVLPEGVSDWGQLYAATSLEMALATYGMPIPCDASKHVARLDGPLPRDTVNLTPVTIFSARDGFEVARGETGLFGSALTLKGPWVERLGSQTMGLVRCQSAP
jgi:hypothetical protein